MRKIVIGSSQHNRDMIRRHQDHISRINADIKELQKRKTPSAVKMITKKQQTIRRLRQQIQNYKRKRNA